jgi:hypothetical protein
MNTLIRTLSPHRWALLILFGLGVVALTILPRNFFMIRFIHEVISTVVWGDLIGHASLFGALTLLLYRTLRWHLGFSPSIWLAVTIGGMIGGLTEWMQRYAAGRDMDRADLMANWLGVAAAGMLICYLQAVIHSRALRER